MRASSNFAFLETEFFLATLLAQHFTPVSQSLGRVFTSAAWRLASLLRFQNCSKMPVSVLMQSIIKLGELRTGPLRFSTSILLQPLETENLKIIF